MFVRIVLSILVLVPPIIGILDGTARYSVDHVILSAFLEGLVCIFITLICETIFLVVGYIISVALYEIWKDYKFYD